MNINASLLGQMITFAILVLFTMKFVWPPLMRMIAERQQKIAAGLAEAEKGRAALAEGEKQKEVMLKAARDQASEMKTLNDKQAQAQIDAAKSQAKIEADRIIASAHAQIDQEKQKAKEALREQVAALAIAGAEKILGREVDAKVHADMLSQLKAQL